MSVFVPLEYITIENNYLVHNGNIFKINILTQNEFDNEINSWIEYI